MLKKFLVILAFIPILGFAQTADPGMLPLNDWNGLMDYIKNGSYTMTYKTLTSPTITGATLTTPTLNGVTGAMAVTTKLTIANNFPMVSLSTITADSIVVPVIAGVANAMAVNAKLNIAANYPLVSSSSIAADTVAFTGGNVQIVDFDTVATAGGTKRWLRLRVSKAAATGKPEYYYMVSDTTSLY